jgi:hypothetical protein
MKTPLHEQGVMAESSYNSLLTPQAPAWFAELQRLGALQSNLPLLPIGWGKDFKGPMLSGWQNHPGRSIDQLIATRGIRSVGARTGMLKVPLLCFDIDGASALELACSLGMEPWSAATWQVHRDNDPNRLKVLFSPTPDQIALLPQDAEFQGKTITKPPVKSSNGELTAKGEALEVFFHGGRQVIVIGEHPSSGGNYLWPEAMGPESLVSPPEVWWQHAIELAGRSVNRTHVATKSSVTRTATKRLDPCPVCGRHSGSGNGLWCVETAQGLILCMPGSTFNADPSASMRIGTVINGYALVKRTPMMEGDCLTFAKDKHLSRRQRIQRPQRRVRSRGHEQS